MNNSDDDRELQQRFARLRSEDQANMPSFDAMLASETLRTPKRRRAVSLRLASAMLVMLVAVVVTVVIQSRLALQRRELWSLRLDPDSVRWEGPTHFLLDTPGRSMLRTMPMLKRQLTPAAPPPSPRRLPRDKGASS